jgi:hypothetical protein
MHCRNLIFGTLIVSLAVLGRETSQGSVQTVFATGFEIAEGYDPEFSLVGQNGWIGTDVNGNGLVADWFAAGDQAAYAGYFPLNPGQADLSIWRPIDFSPLEAGKSIIHFSVTMEIVDSTNDHYDAFRWSVYNMDEERLFTLDFDNWDFGIYYRLDGTNDFVYSGHLFETDVPYALSILMDFSQNRWSASMNGAIIVTNLPITTTGAALTLGDIDAVWFYNDSDAPGDNFMVFDDYRITAEAGTIEPARPRIEPVERLSNGQFLLRLFGENERRYAIEASQDFSTWIPLRTNVVMDGIFDFLDTSAPGAAWRFYRARLVP